jgi:hypothetical protein
VLADAQAKANAAATAAEKTETPSADDKSASNATGNAGDDGSATAKGKTTEISADPATLKTITSLQKAKRELEQQIKTLEEKAKLGDRLGEIESQWKSGKWLDVVGNLSGKDKIEAMQELIAQFVSEPGNDVETKTATQLKELSDKLEAEVKARTDAEAKLQKQTADQEHRATIAFAVSKIDPAKHELCSNERNRNEVAETATEAVPILIRAELQDRLGDEYTAEKFAEHVAALTDEDIARYYGLAYDKIESELAEEGKRYQRASQTAGTSTAATTPAPKPAPKVEIKKPAVSTAPAAPKRYASVQEMLDDARRRANELAEQ